jgi:hypothetical protein
MTVNPPGGGASNGFIPARLGDRYLASKINPGRHVSSLVKCVACRDFAA